MKDYLPPEESRQPAAPQPNEFTAVSPERSGRVSNRPTPSGAEVEEFNQAVEAERQEDA
jgi:hypothetical protein